MPPRWLTVSTEAPPAVIDGRACRTRAALFAEAARALRFPSYFGHNWDALTDCLRGTTRPLVVEHAEDLLGAEPPEQFGTLLAVLAGSGLAVTLCTDRDHEDHLRRRVDAALS